MNVLILDNKVYLETHKTRLQNIAVEEKKKKPNVKIKWFFISEMDFNSSFDGSRAILRNHLQNLINLGKL